MQFKMNSEQKKYWKIGKEFLDQQSYDVLYNNFTELPRQNKYWNFSETGIYVDPVDGTILFTSYDKYFSNCGWPAFLKPRDKADLLYVKDTSHNMIRTEVRTKSTNLHLGHVFNDLSHDLLAEGYQRYCINSAAIKFISAIEILDSSNQLLQKAWQEIIRMHEGKIFDLYLAGGCFWGLELLFKQLPGVLKTQVGYANSNKANPSYKEVCTGTTGATETVYVEFNTEYVTQEQLLDLMFNNINPTQLNYQGNDVGSQYRSGVYFVDEYSGTLLAKLFVNKYQPSIPRIVTELLPLQNFYPAEIYHQDYLIKNPNGYCHIPFKY
ncbi:peptide-methionine (S)-S-oxide reductase MsrA [Candidatus Mycoplasma pogonae]